MTRESYDRLKKIAEDKINKARHFTNDPMYYDLLYAFLLIFVIFIIVLILYSA